VVAHFEVQARTAADAESTLAKCRLDVQDGSMVRTMTEALVYEDGGQTIMVHPSLRLEAIVGPGTRVAVASDNSSVEVLGAVGGCRVDTALGNVRVEGSKGGAIHLTSRSGSLTLSDAQCDAASLRTGHGSIELTAVKTRGLDAVTSSGTLRLCDVAGERIELSTGFGRIELERVTGDCQARTSSGDIDLRAVNGGVLRLETGYGTIRGRQSAGHITARTESGNIHLECASATVTAISRYGRLHVQGDLQQADLRTASGAIELRPATASAPGPFRCISGHGEVRVELPAGMAGELDAEAPNGAVSLDGVDLAGGQVSRQRAQGRIGGGGTRIELLAKSGSVRVQRAR
jgi:DUF4097 and DUF4098 domain-containing protein YvlB